MSQIEKLLDRLKSKPSDFAWSELERILGALGYRQEKGDGSRRRFFHSETGDVISLHEPHAKKILKAYQIRDIVAHLRQKGYL